jgi:LAO/AO transport system ATPase
MAADATSRTVDPAVLVERMLKGDRLALARLITQVENRSPAVPAIMKTVYPRAGAAYVAGITGPPGAGKSTVVDRLTAHLRADGSTVGIVAVDPSSLFTGGAVLGDRIRMQGHALDPGVFIRSMATRGSLGGLARATGEVIKLLAAFGHDWVLVETVGVGQTELDIMKLADTTVVVLVPESGDAIQTMKAGLMEAADVFAVNKADRAGAPALMAELKFAAHLALCELDLAEGHRLGDSGAGGSGPVRRGDHRAAGRDPPAPRCAGGERGAGQPAPPARAGGARGAAGGGVSRAVERGLGGGALRAKLDEVVAGDTDPYSAVAAMLPMVSLEPS